MKQHDTRTAASAAVFVMMLSLSACQKVPELMTIVPGNADRTTAPAPGERHVPAAPALQPYDPTRPPERDFPSTRPRPGMPHPALVKEARSDAARAGRLLLPATPKSGCGRAV